MAVRVLVLGGCGFIGRHVVDRLLALGHEVQVLDDMDERVHHGTVPKMPSGVELIRSRYGNTPAWRFRQAEVVIHLAAQVSVADSAVDPGRYITQNSLETARFLMGLDNSIVKRLVVASSMSVYGEGGVLVKEDAPVCPTSVYGLTKYDQERLCLIWGQQQQVPTAALRFFNVFGQGQALDNPYTGVLANFAKLLLHDQAPQVYEDGLQTRDFIHVSDVADAVIAAAFTNVDGVYNVCTGHPTTVLDAGRTLATALDKEIEPFVTGIVRPGDIRHCTGDPTKARDILGWQAKKSFHDGMMEYGQWLMR